MSNNGWSEDLALAVPELDDVHEEFFELLERVNATPDAQVHALWQAVITHSEAHFALEDLWMIEAGLGADNVHSRQHAAVLEVLREGAQHAEAGNFEPLRQMAHELSLWFPYHCQTMDQVLVKQLKAHQFFSTPHHSHRHDAAPHMATA